MPHETMAVRHAFEVEGRLPRRPRALHAAYREVTLRVPVLDAADAPVVLTVERPLSKDDQFTHDVWSFVSNDKRRPEARQAIPLRMVDGRLVAPVLGPDMLTPVGPDDLATLLARLPSDHDASFAKRAHWPGYPGASRHVPGQGAVTDFLTGTSHPGTALHLCTPVEGLRDVQANAWIAADRAFHARTNGLCIVEGMLWQPCESPLVSLNSVGKTRIVLPGLDGTGEFTTDLAPMLALVDFRCGFASRAMSAGDGPGTVTLEGDPLLPWADVALPNLRLLHARAAQCLAQASFRDVPRSATSLVDALDGIPATLADGTDPEAVQDHVLAEVADLLRPGGEALGSGMFETLVGNAGRWRSLVNEDRRCRNLAAEARNDVGMGAFSP